MVIEEGAMRQKKTIEKIEDAPAPVIEVEGKASILDIYRSNAGVECVFRIGDRHVYLCDKPTSLAKFKGQSDLIKLFRHTNFQYRDGAYKDAN